MSKELKDYSFPEGTTEISDKEILEICTQYDIVRIPGTVKKLCYEPGVAKNYTWDEREQVEKEANELFRNQRVKQFIFEEGIQEVILHDCEKPIETNVPMSAKSFEIYTRKLFVENKGCIVVPPKIKVTKILKLPETFKRIRCPNGVEYFQCYGNTSFELYHCKGVKHVVILGEPQSGYDFAFRYLDSDCIIHVSNEEYANRMITVLYYALETDKIVVPDAEEWRDFPEEKLALSREDYLKTVNWLPYQLEMHEKAKVQLEYQKYFYFDHPQSQHRINLATPYALQQKELVIPDQFTVIADFSRKGGKALIETLWLPKNLSKVEPASFYQLNCLKDFHIDKSNSLYCTVDGVLCNKNTTSIVCFPPGRKGDVVVPEGITSLRASAFNGCMYIESLTLPSTLKTLGVASFGGCESIKHIELPKSVNKVGDAIFCNCRSLEEFVVPEKIKVITASMFRGCTSLHTIKLHDKVTRIEDRAFEDCTSLKTIHITKKVEYVSDSAFDGCRSIKFTISEKNEHFTLNKKGKLRKKK